MVLSPTFEKFSMLSMSQKVHMRADSAYQHSKERDAYCINATDYQEGDAACLNGSHGSGSFKQNNLPAHLNEVCGSHPEGNGKANRDSEIDKDSSDLASLFGDEKAEKPGDRPDLKDLLDESAPCNESEESDAMEQDVKVCDICGDAGREDLLAMCCRCTDGAEHTYCMREMLQKVPEGDWLCEECKIAEESARQKSGLDFEEKDSTKPLQILGKRPAEDRGVAYAAKKRALEVTVGSPKISNLDGAAAFSRNSFLKNTKRGKGRVDNDDSETPRSSHAPRIENNDDSETPRSSNAPRIEVSKNSFLKSNSFSALTAKSKVKQVEGGFLQKPRGTRNHSSVDAKMGSLRTLGKSASFKHVNQGGIDALDSKAKIFPAKYPNVQDSKGGSKHWNEQNPADRNRLTRVDQDRANATRSGSTSYTKLEQKPPSQSDSHSLSSANDSLDSNNVLSDGKRGPSLSRSTSYVARRGTDGTVGSAGSSYTEGGCNTSVNKRSNLISPKGGIVLGLSCSSEKPCNSVTDSIQDAQARARESINHLERTHESFGICLVKAVTSGSRMLVCEKCSECGHTTDFCSHGSSQGPPTKFDRGDMNYKSKSTVAVTSAMLKKPGIYRKNKGLDKSDNLSGPSAPATQGQFPLSDLSKKSENVSQLNGLNEATYSPKPGSSETREKLLRELRALWKASIIPEHDFIWQGGFQVHRGSEQIDLHGGFQAHLPMCVSPMVLKLVTQFPDKIALNEVPRVSTWPFQFRDYGIKEEHIAIYFFARDLESYESNYRSLLDNMMKSDLALKGNLGRAELLIFPSNQLPEKSQRWNMSFYLWGVFKISRANCLNYGVGEGCRTKQEIDNCEASGLNDSRAASPSRDGFFDRIHDPNNCSAALENLRSNNDVKVLGTRTAEKFLFPVSCHDSKELKTGNSSIPFKSISSSDNDVIYHAGVPVPDLELALGAETTLTSKGISFLVDLSKPSSSDRVTTAPNENEGGDHSASLSLSLSFPFSDEERRTVKPIPKDKKLLQEGTL